MQDKDIVTSSDIAPQCNRLTLHLGAQGRLFNGGGPLTLPVDGHLLLGGHVTGGVVKMSTASQSV